MYVSGLCKEAVTQAAVVCGRGSLTLSCRVPVEFWRFHKDSCLPSLSTVIGARWTFFLIRRKLYPAQNASSSILWDVGYQITRWAFSCSQLFAKHRHRQASVICRGRTISVHSRLYPLLSFFSLLFISQFLWIFPPPHAWNFFSHLMFFNLCFLSANCLCLCIFVDSKFFIKKVNEYTG